MKVHTEIETLGSIEIGGWVAFRYKSADNWTVAAWEDCQVEREFASVLLSGIWHELSNELDFEVFEVQPGMSIGDVNGAALSTDIYLLRPYS